MSVPDKANNSAKDASGKQENAVSKEINTPDKEAVKAAHEQADHDMDEDPDLSIHSPNDDLDEGETARLGNDENPLI